MTDRGQHWRSDVQGLRAVAVLGVLLYHADVPWLAGGFVGVDVFFVISGFLITQNLLRERRDTGRIALRRFFTGRLIRLGPAALVTIAVTLIAGWALLPPLDRLGLRADAWAATLGLQNVLLARSGTDYLADHTPGLFQQFWSLGVEEQFYFGWAILLATVSAVPALRNRLVAVIAALCAISFVAVLVQSAASGPWAFFGVHTRSWELGAGALVAAAAATEVRVRRGRRASDRPARVRRWSGLVGLTLIVGAYVVFDSTTRFPGFATLVPVVGALLLVARGHDADPVRRLLGTRAMTWIGDRSYSLYLWHWPALVLPTAALGRDLAAGEVLIAGAVTLTLAWASHRYLERGAARWFRTRPRRPMALVGAAALVCALVVPMTAIPELRSTASTASAEPRRVLDGPVSPTSVPANLTPSILDAGRDLPIVYENGCHAGPSAVTSSLDACVLGDRHSAGPIVLLGDSHAAQWTTPLREVADSTGRQLVVLTRSACPVVDLSVRSVELGRAYHECTSWREHSMEQVEALQPSLVIVANASAGYRTLVETADFAAEWGAGLERQLDTIGQHSDAPLALVEDTPRWDTTPNRCLSASVDRVDGCVRPTDELTAPDVLEAERAAARASGVAILDPVPWMCTTTCSPVVWNVLAYRDSNHITDELASALTPRLRDALGPLLAPATP